MLVCVDIGIHFTKLLLDDLESSVLHHCASSSSRHYTRDTYVSRALDLRLDLWCAANTGRQGSTKTFQTGVWQSSNKSTTHNYPPRYTSPLASTAISILTTPTYLQSQNLCILNETAEPSTVAAGLDKIPFKGDGLLVT